MLFLGLKIGENNLFTILLASVTIPCMTNAYTLIADQGHAINAAAYRADINGAPVAVITRDRWFRLVEDADEMDRLIDEERWEQVAVIDPVVQ